MSEEQWVVVFFPRHYEFSPPSEPQIVYGPAPKDWCENKLREINWNGGPAGGHHSIRKAKVTVGYE